jgi:shikimate kinase/3-dehydroquinate synthase
MRFLPAPRLLPGRPRLVVTGFAGTGKTTVGRIAAGLLGLPFFDLDAVIERRSGRSVWDIFEINGEPEFRRLERQAMADGGQLSAAVVATGGGAVEDRTTFGRLCDGATVSVLLCEEEELLRRLSTDGRRPLLRPDLRTRLRELLATRTPLYTTAGEAVDTTGRTAEEVAAEVASRYRQSVGSGGPVRLEVEGPDGPYPVVVGSQAIAGLGEELAKVVPDAALAAVAVDAAAEAAGQAVSDSLERAGIRVATRILLPPGEAAKTAGVVADLWTRLREAGLGPGDVVVAVGGGAALDSAGFAAATYARGVPLVNVPTTLLAMVDAAVGGKVGVDHDGVKNLVGSFHHPRLAVADPVTLASLPPGALRSGLAEMVKAAVLASPLALEMLEGLEASSLDKGGTLEWIVEQAVRIKAAYVARDPRDLGIRHALNLGHTFAHALEAATDYRIPHGDAVAMGLVAASRLGEELGATPPGLEGRLRRLFGRLGLPTDPPPGLDQDRILQAMRADKKREAGRAVFVVPAPGGAVLLDEVAPQVALRSLLSALSDGGRVR